MINYYCFSKNVRVTLFVFAYARIETINKMYRSNDTIKDLNLLDIVSRRCCINNPPLVRYESQRIVSNCNSFKFYDPSHTLRKIELNFFVIPTHS